MDSSVSAARSPVPNRSTSSGPEPGVFLGIADQRRVDVDALYAALARPGAAVGCGVRVTQSEVADGLGTGDIESEMVGYRELLKRYNRF